MSSPTQWQQDVLQLQQAGRRLSQTMRRAAEDLQGDGLEPSDELLDELQRFCGAFRRLREDVLEAGCLSAPMATLSDLTTMLALRERLATAQRVATEALRLVPRDGDAGAVLAERIRAEVSAVSAVLETATPPADLVEALLEGRHPLAAAVQLVRQAEQLGDGEWEQQLDIVRMGLGRDVATALARGRLVWNDSVAA